MDPNSNLIRYEGLLTSEVRVQLTDLLLAIAVSNLGSRSDLKKLFGVAVELLDNAQRYCSSGSVSFEWHIEGTELVIAITNKASKADAERLIDRVAAIQAMSPEQLADAFRQQLQDPSFGEKGGAGLGMLQIARRVGQAINARISADANGDYICTSQVTTTLRTR
ncbi:MAG: ATP-binding protein [Flavobacteriales bacterium]|nr:ATP-binding protein [Flavobacteriales bacterium]